MRASLNVAGAKLRKNIRISKSFAEKQIIAIIGFQYRCKRFTLCRKTTSKMIHYVGKSGWLVSFCYLLCGKSCIIEKFVVSLHRF